MLIVSSHWVLGRFNLQHSYVHRQLKQPQITPFWSDSTGQIGQVILSDFFPFQWQYMFPVDLKKFLEPATQCCVHETSLKMKCIFFLGWFEKLWRYSPLSLYIQQTYVSITRHRIIQSIKKDKEENASDWVKFIHIHIVRNTNANISFVKSKFGQVRVGGEWSQ